MASAISQLASAPFANMLVIAALGCIAIAIFGWARETIAASSGFRAVSGLTGALLLFCVYGIYLPHAARNAGSNDPEDVRSTEMRGAPAQQVSATSQTQSLAQKPQSALLAPESSSLTQQQTPPAAQQQQSAQSSTPQAAAQSLFSGRWKNADVKAAGILFLKVEERGDEITVRAWGACGSAYCDWGTGHGMVRDGKAVVTWKQGPVLRRMKLEPDGGSLRVVLDSTSRGRPQHMQAHLAKGL